ncbi:hypothetical protein NMY22_g970 [Coprinellus aureogranulatus]|nr:hypothetical protein NMY22_g970 [Coprinellus aureogranulatus]
MQYIRRNQFIAKRDVVDLAGRGSLNTGGISWDTSMGLAFERLRRERMNVFFRNYFVIHEACPVADLCSRRTFPAHVPSALRLQPSILRCPGFGKSCCCSESRSACVPTVPQFAGDLGLGSKGVKMTAGVLDSEGKVSKQLHMNLKAYDSPIRVVHVFDRLRSISPPASIVFSPCTLHPSVSSAISASLEFRTLEVNTKLERKCLVDPNDDLRHLNPTDCRARQSLHPSPHSLCTLWFRAPRFPSPLMPSQRGRAICYRWPFPSLSSVAAVSCGFDAWASYLWEDYGMPKRQAAGAHGTPSLPLSQPVTILLDGKLQLGVGRVVLDAGCRFFRSSLRASKIKQLYRGAQELLGGAEGSVVDLLVVHRLVDALGKAERRARSSLFHSRRRPSLVVDPSSHSLTLPSTRSPVVVIVDLTACPYPRSVSKWICEAVTNADERRWCESHARAINPRTARTSVQGLKEEGVEVDDVL